MGLFDSLTKYFERRIEAQSADLADPGQPRVSGSGNKALSPYLGKAKGSKLPNSLTNTTNLVLSTHVRSGTLQETVKKLVTTSPDLSHAVETKIKTAIPQNHSGVCYSSADGKVDEEATRFLHRFLMRLDLGSYDYTKFTRSTDLRSFASSVLFDSFRYGSMCAEVVLGKTRTPAYFSPICSRLVSWADDSPNTYPIYKAPGGDIPLNYPTVFYSCTIQDGETPYSDSPLQASIQACLWDADFVDALRRAAVKNLLQRLVITINSEKYIQTLTLDQQADKKLMKEAMDQTAGEVETYLATLEPDDALVLFDIMSADTVADKNRSEDRTMTVLQAIINGKIAAGAKILPSIIGRGESSNAASTESALFLKSISASQDELNIFISRMLTLCMRLFGFDVYVWFHFEEVNLRPALELESFKAIRQSTILMRLSLGMIDDMTACIQLTGEPPPDGYVPLSGTKFSVSQPSSSGNDYSNTSVSADGKPDSTQAQKSGEVKTTGVKSQKNA